MKLNSLQELKNKIEECKNKQSVTKRLLTFCCSSGCVANKSLDVKSIFDNLIAENNLNSDIETKTVGCFGFCSQGPFVKVYPDNVTYKLVKESDVKEIFDLITEVNKMINSLITKLGK